MRGCCNCRHGERLTDEGGKAFVMCRALPPRPVGDAQQSAWVQPPMKLWALCGLHRFGWWKMIFGHGTRIKG